MFKEKNLIFRAGKEVAGESAAEGQGGRINFSGNAEDPDAKLKEKSKANIQEGQYVTDHVVNMDDVESNTDDEGTLFLKFGGDRIGITGVDIQDVLSIDELPGGNQYVDIAVNGKNRFLAIWDGDKKQYTYLDGPNKNNKVRFLNGNRYQVSSASKRIMAENEYYAARGENAKQPSEVSPEGKVTLGEVALVTPTPKAQSRFAELDAQRGSSVDQTVNDALAQYNKPAEVQPTEQMLAMREKMATKEADDAKMRAELEAQYLREGEEPGKVAISFLKRRADAKAQEIKAEQAKKEFPAKLPEVKMLGRVDGGHKLELPNGRLALYLEVPNKTVVPSADRKAVAIYNKNDELEEVKDFSQLKPHTQSKINALYS